MVKNYKSMLTQNLPVKFKLLQTKCAFPEKIQTHPMEGHWKSKGEGDLKAKYETKLEFSGRMGGGGGCGCKTKKLLCGYGYFLELNNKFLIDIQIDYNVKILLPLQ